MYELQLECGDDDLLINDHLLHFSIFPLFFVFHSLAVFPHTGLLQREHDAAVVYGSIDTGKNIKVDEEFKTKVELMK